MNEYVIDGVVNVLKYKGREDLANLLKNSSYRIEESPTYGSYLYSILSTFEIYSPYKEYEKLNQLNEEDINEILNAVLDIIPPKPNSIEINGINFMCDMALDGDKCKKEINTDSDFKSKSINEFESIDMNTFWNAFKAYISEIEEKGFLKTFCHLVSTYEGEYWKIDSYRLVRSMIQEIDHGEYPLKNQPENKIIIKLVEFFFRNVSIPDNDDRGAARYDYTIRINNMFDNFCLPLRLLKGRVTFNNSIILSNLLKNESLSYLDKDPVLRDLMNEAVIFFTDSKQINIDTALEKIANSLERVKTILDMNEKKKSTEKIIGLLSKDADIRRFLDNHLKQLNFICNNYLIRHKEVNQKSFDSEELKQFLFYEFFNVIRFILKKIDQEKQ